RRARCAPRPRCALPFARRPPSTAHADRGNRRRARDHDAGHEVAARVRIVRQRAVGRAVRDRGDRAHDPPAPGGPGRGDRGRGGGGRGDGGGGADRPGDRSGGRDEGGLPAASAAPLPPPYAPAPSMPPPPPATPAGVSPHAAPATLACTCSGLVAPAITLAT